MHAAPPSRVDPARLPPPSAREHRAHFVRQFIKYGIVGASNTAITFVIYTVGVEVGVPYLVALLAGYLVGGLNSYLLNRHWTFDAGHLSHASSGGRFALVQGGAIAANLILLYVLVHQLHVAKIGGQAILTVPVVLVTFFINRKWTFAASTLPAAEVAEPVATHTDPR